MALPAIKIFAIPGVSTLIAFLSYSSQYLLLRLEPRPLKKEEILIFNGLIGCIWICYFRACFTNPGGVPRASHKTHGEEKVDAAGQTPGKLGRWCKKCDTLKPPRAHHCKECKRCIPKMDHHCPWTVNCVSHTTFPHFIRFVFYAVAAMTYLEYFLYLRAEYLWQNRSLPSLIHLFVLIITNSVTLFALSVLLVRSLWSLGANTTTIEGWEIDRHHALVRRARILGGYAYGPDGIKVRVKRQEFPYDIGIWKNIKQGMGGSWNIVSWFWPFAASPSVESGMNFEVNGFEDASLSWPPLDPERIPRTSAFASSSISSPFTDPAYASLTPSEQKEAYNRRQQADFRRRGGTLCDKGADVSEEDEDYDENDELAELEVAEEPEWTNSEGDRLRDFGVDEDTEILDEDEVPLGELLRRRRATATKKTS